MMMLTKNGRMFFTIMVIVFVPSDLEAMLYSASRIVKTLLRINRATLIHPVRQRPMTIVVKPGDKRYDRRIRIIVLGTFEIIL